MALYFELKKCRKSIRFGKMSHAPADQIGEADWYKFRLVSAQVIQNCEPNFRFGSEAEIQTETRPGL
jgi:hypothetical protein